MKLIVIPFIALLLSLSAGLLVALAYAVGWLLKQFLELSTLEATALSMAGIFTVVFTVVGTLKALNPFPLPLGDYEDEEDWEEEVKVTPPKPTPRRKR